jgi:acetyltransferase-like isoleucine patch superfamily enzyme
MARRMGVTVGEDCRFFSTNFSTEPFLISIGNHVTITDGVKFVTHDGATWIFRKEHPGLNLFGRIQIGDNVFIGINSIILPNTKIGNNSVIAAGAIVKGCFENDSIIAGVPAKRIMSTNEYFEKNKDRFVVIQGLSGEKRMEYIRQITSVLRNNDFPLKSAKSEKQ